MVDEDIIFHYRHDLLEAMVSAIGLLNKGKKGILTFLEGAGVQPAMMAAEIAAVQKNKDSIGKFEIARNVLVRLNAQGNDPAAIRRRREIAKRVVEWEDYSTCWETDQLKAKGAVAEVRRLINVYDSFTRMKEDRDAEAQKHRQIKDAAAKAAEKRVAEFERIKNEFYGLFAEKDAHKRGKLLEKTLNALFKHGGILIREDFTIRCDESGKPLEQIDGVIEIDNIPYLVEMKWWDQPIGVPEIGQHMNRLFLRMRGGAVRGMFISYSGFTDTAVSTVKEGLAAGAMIFLCTLQDFVRLVESKGELGQFCRDRIRRATVDKQPYILP